jgi:hypothetical protein
MGAKNITTDLLKKYHSGLCNAEERLAVESWLESDDDELGYLHQPAEEQEIEDSLWAEILGSTIAKDQQKRPHKFRIYQYGIAASIFIAFSATLLYFHFPAMTNEKTFVNLRNIGTDAMEQNIDGLILTALPKSNVHAVLNTGLQSGDISFCEVMLLKNESRKDMEIRFDTPCASQSVKPKSYTLKKGITYVALRADWKSPEIIVVDQRYLEDLLPLNVAMKINKKIQSI